MMHQNIMTERMKKSSEPSEYDEPEHNVRKDEEDRPKPILESDTDSGVYIFILIVHYLYEHLSVCISNFVKLLCLALCEF